MTGARTAIALYVAVALHAVALLFLLLVPTPQMGPGAGIGLTLAGAGSVLAAPAGPSRPVDARAPTMATRVPTAPSRPRSDPDQPGASARSDPGFSAPGEVIATAVPAGGVRGPGGPGDGGGNTGGGGTDTYYARLRTHLAAFRREIPGAVPAGRAEVRFTVLPDGRVADVMLERSSGSQGLDTEALALIERAQPLPRPPRGDALRLRVPVYVGG